jgi:hypothetical protein
VIEAPKDIHERALARAACTHKRDELTFSNRKRHALEYR